jgi:hypothetical protein
MATITYKGLSGIRGTLTVNSTDTLADIAAAIIAVEELNGDYYADFILDRNNTISFTNNSTDTYAELGLLSTDTLVAILENDPSVYNKEQRQLQKLEIAQVKRAGDGNPRFFYDITQLPNPYNDNGVDPDENPNTGGLVQGRPWVELAAGLYRRTYTGYFVDDPGWFASATQTAAGADSTLAIAETPTETSIQWLGYFVPATTETYTFYTSSDDASYLWVGANAVSGFTTGNALVNNGGSHGVETASGSIALTAGVRYAIRIQTGNGGGPGSHATSFSTPTIAQTSTFTNRIFYNPVVNGI